MQHLFGEKLNLAFCALQVELGGVHGAAADVAQVVFFGFAACGVFFWVGHHALHGPNNLRDEPHQQQGVAHVEDGVEKGDGHGHVGGEDGHDEVDEGTEEDEGDNDTYHIE